MFTNLIRGNNSARSIFKNALFGFIIAACNTKIKMDKPLKVC